MSSLVDLAYGMGLLAYGPVLAYRAIRTGKYRTGWRERLGHVARLGANDPLIWIHAVSMGEVNSTQTLADRIGERFPDHRIAVSTTTDTGRRRATALYGPERTFYYPLDFSWVVRRALRRLAPQLIVLVELEVWYNLVHEAQLTGIPVIVVNGRLTENSFKRYQLAGPIARAMFSRLDWIGAQDETIAGRFAALGAPKDRIHITGALKYDTAPLADYVDGQELLADSLSIAVDRPFLVAGQTGPGEEAIVLDAFGKLRERFADLQLAIVPRKPERFDEAARLIERRGWRCIRRSTHSDGSPSGPIDDRCVILGDTMGELRKFYALADAVFVGRTIAPLGGSDILEVAGLAKPMVIGPSFYNFQAPVELLVKGEGLIVLEEASDYAVPLAETLRRFLSDRKLRERTGAAARSVVKANQGTTAHTVAAIEEMLERRNRRFNRRC
jgi:3-deoxy-D-manno-octulosonic-acid transferase